MNMKRKEIILSLAALFALFSGCKKDWEDHYFANQPVSVDMNMWDTLVQIDEVSSFVQYMQEFEFDTLFQGDKSYTLFIPNNTAFESYITEDTVNRRTLEYHISNHFIQSGNIQSGEKIQMISEKFVPMERLNTVIQFDGIPLETESPLFRNGKFFILGQVAKPKPNIYEYYADNNPILAQYIKSLDSIILDKELSRPIGFDEEGNTVYDTVLIIQNDFEDDYFPIREEFRSKTATVVFPRGEDYNSALDVMANIMGDVYTDHNDIPIEWQFDYLLPYLLEHGVFENSLEKSAFVKTGGPLDTLKLKNIIGDSIAIDYQVDEKTECSNGIVFNFLDFQIPDTLFKGSVRIEFESLTKKAGVNFAWDEEFAVQQSSTTFAPVKSKVAKASNDSVVKVLFSPDYTGSYSLDFKVDNLFPRKYLMVVRTNKTIGGIFNIYLNGDLIKTMDYYDYVTTGNGYYYLSVTGDYIFHEGGYSYWDAWADNKVPYGDASIRIEYVEPGDMSVQGFIIDYIDFIPYDE